MKIINVLSLFDGISIAQQALKEVEIPIKNYYASEIDKWAIAITQKNFPGTIQLGDVKNVEKEMVEDIDLIIGGSPCQDLSIANKNREGLQGSRSRLFYEFVRLVKEVKPKYFILENVNSMPKESKQIITNELFGIEPVMINASLVSAQNRKRLFWVGKLVGDTYEKVEIEQPKDRGILLKDILEKNIDEKYFLKKESLNRIINRGCPIVNEPTCWNNYNKKLVKNGKTNTLTLPHYNSTRLVLPIRIGSLNKESQGDRIYSLEGKSVNLSANGGGGGAKTGLYAIAVAQRGRHLVNGKRKDILGAKTEQRMEFGGNKSNMLSTVQKDSYVLKNDKIRKLTPIECERLQSLPDNYTAKGIINGKEIDISDTQRYKTLGNGFNCEVIKHILRQLNCKNKTNKKIQNHLL